MLFQSGICQSPFGVLLFAFMSSFVEYMILKCAAKKFACAAHAAKNEGQAHMKQPSILFSVVEPCTSI